MASPPLLFQSESAALQPIAGIPCAARAVEMLAERGVLGPGETITVAIPGAWNNPRAITEELTRLAPRVDAILRAIEDIGEGKDALDALAIVAGEAVPGPRPAETVLARSRRENRRLAADASRRVVAATGKTTDGLVSQWINRPVSRFMSYYALLIPGIRPIHGTIAAALVGIAMALSLFFGGKTGLYAGAVLFQLASIIDGVDGEIARATKRSSKRGATLDTATDAATNFAFIAGVSVNIWQSGEVFAGQAGLAGLALMMTGLALIGARSLAAGGPLSFDMLKHQARAGGSPVIAALAKVTSRDVYALVLALMIIAGFAGPAMMIFAAAATIWFVTAIVMLLRGPAI